MCGSFREAVVLALMCGDRCVSVCVCVCDVDF